MELILCEKPKVGRDTARLLGVKQQHQEYIVCKDGTVVTWAIGHLLEQDEPASYDERYRHWSWNDLPIVPEVFTISPKPSTKAQLGVVKGLLKKNFQSPDRHGRWTRRGTHRPRDPSVLRV